MPKPSRTDYDFEEDYERDRTAGMKRLNILKWEGEVPQDKVEKEGAMWKTVKCKCCFAQWVCEDLPDEPEADPEADPETAHPQPTFDLREWWESLPANADPLCALQELLQSEKALDVVREVQRALGSTKFDREDSANATADVFPQYGDLNPLEPIDPGEELLAGLFPEDDGNCGEKLGKYYIE